ncbi:MAG: hypothetical protein IK130_02450 [Oscillospiraceae bacterium]|nr:hypothetical protein [Oscillospiraceae bacterium]
METNQNSTKPKKTVKERLKAFFRKQWVQALLNPHFLISIGIAWFITNGWSYCALGLGAYFGINWLRNIGAVWLGILWMPGTPEKLVTFSIAIVILRLLFPKDTKTLAVIHEKRLQLIDLTKKSFQKFRDKFKRKKPAQIEQNEPGQIETKASEAEEAPPENDP